MGLTYMFNDPAQSPGPGLAPSGGLGLRTLAIALGPTSQRVGTERPDDVADASAIVEVGQKRIPKKWIRGRLAVGGILLVLLSVLLSGSS
jgi:hypothetical protein